MQSSVAAICNRKVAVIGAGAAGLVTARELVRQGHEVVIYEQTQRIGGVWAYNELTEDDPIGFRQDRIRVHSSLYASLRTNLPREVMGFLDYPFVAKPGRDARRFPGHNEVLLYLEDFAADFGLIELVKFDTEVIHAELTTGPLHEWIIRSKKETLVSEAHFDAVVVCNGHYSQPKIAEIPGIQQWPGKQYHSHNYRTPELFKDKVVVVIGNSSSGEDISKELASVAKEVHVSARKWPANVELSKPLKDGKLWRHMMVDKAYDDGKLHFEDGKTIFVDIILHCTGYLYSFPFLETQGVITVDDNRVGPLYKHIFPPSFAPLISFVGLPFKVIPFPLCELQAKWIALLLSGKRVLPTVEEMLRESSIMYQKLEEKGIAKRDTHSMDMDQFVYMDWLTNECEYCPVDCWRKEIFLSTRKNKMNKPDLYRDVWYDDEFLNMALASFSTKDKFKSK